MFLHRARTTLLAVAFAASLATVPAAAAELPVGFARLVTVLQLAIAMRKSVPFHLARRFCVQSADQDHPASDLARKKIVYACLRELAQKVTVEKPDKMTPMLF